MWRSEHLDSRGETVVQGSCICSTRRLSGCVALLAPVLMGLCWHVTPKLACRPLLTATDQYVPRLAAVVRYIVVTWYIVVT